MRAASATSSSRSSSCSWCTVASTSGCGRATLEALKALIDGGYVGREDGKGFGLAYQFLRTLEHRIQLFRLRRTHVLPDRRGGSAAARPIARLRRSGQAVAGDLASLPASRFAGCTSGCSTPRCSTPSHGSRRRSCGSPPRRPQDRLKALGYADPQASLRHIAALSQGVTRQAEIQRQLLPAMLGWFADAPPIPTRGCWPSGRCRTRWGARPWYLRALRDEGTMAERLARILASSRYAVQLLKRAPQTVQMLADDADLVPRPLEDLDSEMQAAAGRAGGRRHRPWRRSGPSAVASCSGSPPATSSG